MRESDSSRQLGSMPFEIPGNIDDQSSLIALDQQHDLQQVRALVVEQILPPVGHDQLGNQDGDLPVFVVLLLLENEIQHRGEDVAVRRCESHESRNLESSLAQRLRYLVLPFIADAMGVVAALNVHGENLWRYTESEFQGLFGKAAPAINRNDDNRRLDIFDTERVWIVR